MTPTSTQRKKSIKTKFAIKQTCFAVKYWISIDKRELIVV